MSPLARAIRTRGRCLAYHLDTGARCRRAVADPLRARDAARLRVCREHARSAFVIMTDLSPSRRHELAFSSWTNVREVQS